jgi:hypothetical protein
MWPAVHFMWSDNRPQHHALRSAQAQQPRTQARTQSRLAAEEPASPRLPPCPADFTYSTKTMPRDSRCQVPTVSKETIFLGMLIKLAKCMSAY